MYKYFQEHDLLTWRNSGYKALDSSMTQLVFITHKIYKAFVAGHYACLVSLDATSAFDHVWHAGLPYKLNQKGVTGPLFLWLQSCFKNRKQRVAIKGQTSDWKDVAAGVPRVSILGPLLF